MCVCVCVSVCVSVCLCLCLFVCVCMCINLNLFYIQVKLYFVCLHSNLHTNGHFVTNIRIPSQFKDTDHTNQIARLYTNVCNKVIWGAIYHAS